VYRIQQVRPGFDPACSRSNKNLKLSDIFIADNNPCLETVRQRPDMVEIIGVAQYNLLVCILQKTLMN
jgi:hypothetical protein